MVPLSADSGNGEAVSRDKGDVAADAGIAVSGCEAAVVVVNAAMACGETEFAVRMEGGGWGADRVI